MNAILQDFLQHITRRRETSVPGKPPLVEAAPALRVAPGIEFARDDPFLAYCAEAPGIIEIEQLAFESPGIEGLKAVGVKLVLPLVSQGELVGLLNLGARRSDQDYTPDDYRLLNNLSTQAAAALHVAQLARRQQVEARQLERFEQQLRIAGIIQQTLLPKEIPVLAGWQLAAYWQPAQTVGGDFYDFLPLPNGQIVLIIGDVTDKGVPAALLMASTRSIVRAAAERLHSPGEVLKRANNALCPDMPPKMFVTCLCAILDPDSGQLRYANAGHNSPYQRTADDLIELRARGMPLGLMANMVYEEKETRLAPGDSILFYSDGLVEAHNVAREMFGEPRLKQLLATHPGGKDLIEYLRAELNQFAGAAWEQEDDVTLVTLQRTLQGRSASTANGKDMFAEFTIPSEPGNERLAMDRVVEATRELNLPTPVLERLNTAVAEVVMNAMEHGNHYRPDAPVVIVVEASHGMLSVRITDQGSGQPIPQGETPDLEAKLAGKQPARGWGLFLVRNMVDDVRIISDASHHTVELILRLEGGRDDHAEPPI